MEERNFQDSDVARIAGIKKGDWKAIAFCVFAAVTFWFFNAMSNNYSVDVSHPLIIHYDEDEYAPLQKLPSSIRFSTTASGWDIFTKTNFINSIPIELELDDFKKKKYITAARLKIIVAKQMHGIQINEIQDDTIYVSFEKLKSKKVKLQPDTKKLGLAEGHRLAGQIVLEPSWVTVSGPSSLIKNVPDVVFVKIEAKEVSGRYEEEFPMQTNLDKRIKLSEEKVKVSLETYQLQSVEKELKIEKVNFPKKKKITLSNEHVRIVCYAREEDIETVEKQDWKAQIDYKSLDEQNKTIRIKLKKTPDLAKECECMPKVIQIKYGE